jgi:methyl-accepting chemotaxis protein
LNKRLAAAAVLLPVCHAALYLLFGQKAAVTALAIAADLAAFAILAFLPTKRRPNTDAGAVSAGASAPPAADLEALAVADGEEAEEAAEAPSSQAGDLSRASAEARLEEIGVLAERCLRAFHSTTGGDARLAAAKAAASELHAAIALAREDSGVINENTDRIFEIANNLANSAEQASSLAHEVESKASAMTAELASSLDETDGLIAESKRITDILTIMSDISSTTNILSFNASIVAANSGAHGKPFAVVAKEMRKLSESTEASLKDITSIVRTIQEKVAKVSQKIRAVNDGVKDEKESLVAVAGNLQGVMLANEVIRTVSGLCVQKSSEALASLDSLGAKAESAARALEAEPEGAAGGPTGAGDLASSLERLAGLAKGD